MKHKSIIFLTLFSCLLTSCGLESEDTSTNSIDSGSSQIIKPSKKQLYEILDKVKGFENLDTFIGEVITSHTRPKDTNENHDIAYHEIVERYHNNNGVTYEENVLTEIKENGVLQNNSRQANYKEDLLITDSDIKWQAKGEIIVDKNHNKFDEFEIGDYKNSYNINKDGKYLFDVAKESIIRQKEKRLAFYTHQLEGYVGNLRVSTSESLFYDTLAIDILDENEYRIQAEKVSPLSSTIKQVFDVSFKPGVYFNYDCKDNHYQTSGFSVLNFIEEKKFSLAVFDHDKQDFSLRDSAVKCEPHLHNPKDFKTIYYCDCNEELDIPTGDINLTNYSDLTRLQDKKRIINKLYDDLKYNDVKCDPGLTYKTKLFRQDYSDIKRRDYIIDAEARINNGFVLDIDAMTTGYLGSDEEKNYQENTGSIKILEAYKDNIFYRNKSGFDNTGIGNLCIGDIGKYYKDLTNGGKDYLDNLISKLNLVDITKAFLKEFIDVIEQNKTLKDFTLREYIGQNAYMFIFKDEGQFGETYKIFIKDGLLYSSIDCDEMAGSFQEHGVIRTATVKRFIPGTPDVSFDFNGFSEASKDFNARDNVFELIEKSKLAFSIHG